jgi:hypothetical protein
MITRAKPHIRSSAAAIVGSSQRYSIWLIQGGIHTTSMGPSPAVR